MDRMITNVTNPTMKRLCDTNPTAKLVTALLLGIAAGLFPTPLPSLVIIIVLFVIAGASGNIKGFSKVMLGFGIPITIMLVFIQGFYGTGNKTVILDCGFAKLGLEGTIYALNTVTTLLVFLGTLTLMNYSTYTGELVADLTERGLSPKAGYMVLATLNVVPQMQRKMSTIQEAQVARGLDVGGNMISRLRATIPLFGPVIISSLTDAEERSMTLETHGFELEGTKHTSLAVVNHSSMDRVFVAISVVVLVVAIAARVASAFGVPVL